MTTFTSSLPDDLLLLLNEKAMKMNLPKNKLIENALRIYLDQLERAAYVKSYRQMKDDTDILSVAEEGMKDYFAQIQPE